MKRYISQLIIALLVLIGVFMVVTVSYAANQLEEKQIKLVQQSLKRDLNLMADDLSWTNEDSHETLQAYLAKKTKDWQALTSLRITLIEDDGTVIVDSENDAKGMENHLTRPEIKKAMNTNKISYDTRISVTDGKSLVYAALPIRAEGELVGFLRVSSSTKEIDYTVQNLWTITLIGLIVGLLLASVIGYRMGWRLSRYLEEINKAAEQIMRMNFNVKVNVPDKDEIGKLGLTINTIAENFNRQMGRILESERQLSNVVGNMVSGVVMLDEEGRFVLLNRTAEKMLGYKFEELRGKLFFESQQQSEFLALVAESYDRREKMREELMFYYPQESMMEVNIVPMFQKDNHWVGMLIVINDVTAIRRLEKMRSEFVANVSHELKTPIAAIKGFAETLLAGATNDPVTMESFLKIIFDESNRLDRLVMDILDLSKMESKRIPLFFSPIHLNQFVANVMNMLKRDAEAKKITLTNQIDASIYLEADEDRLRQIMLNLLSNGINYSPGGGKVTVMADVYVDEQDGIERVRITVEDTGLGIPKKDLPRIFERFYRVDKARSRVSGGTGLGLSIVKHLVELHQGTIHVQSTLGVGSKFICDLPVVHD